MNLLQLSRIAIQAALSAGKVIQKYRNEEVDVEHKKGSSSYASQVVTIVDKESENEILAHLLPTCKKYDLALLSEEMEDDGGRYEKDFFWCIDPMDGTLPFINKQPGFSVSIALVSKGGTPMIGVIYDPSRDTLYHAIKGHGAFKNDKPWNINHTNDYLTYVTDRKLKDTPRAPEIEQLLFKKAERLHLQGFKEKSGAGAVLNSMLVLEHSPACMLKLPKEESGGGCIWDFAASACIYQELSLPATDFAGEKLDLNSKEGVYMNQRGIYYASFELGGNHNL